MPKTEQNVTDVPILSRLSPPEGALGRHKRKGRGPGSGLGKTSGKGMKGQKARHPGAFGKLHFEGGQTPLQRRLPKFGFTPPFPADVRPINVGALQRFDEGTEVTVEALYNAGLANGQVDRIKILGSGELSKKLKVHAHGFSASARSKIESAGGEVVTIATRKPNKSH